MKDDFSDWISFRDDESVRRRHEYLQQRRHGGAPHPSGERLHTGGRRGHQGAFGIVVRVLSSAVSTVLTIVVVVFAIRLFEIDVSWIQIPGVDLSWLRP